MSERRKKEERLRAKEFEEEEKERILKEYLWNTSTAIREAVSGVGQSPEWAKFSAEYDKIPHQKHRLDELYKNRTWRGLSTDLFDLNKLAEEATESNEVAARELGWKIIKLIEGEKDFRNFVDAVKMRRKRESGICEAVYALRRIIERVGKLPTREELNREAYRIKNLKRRKISWEKWFKEHSSMGKFEFGDRLGNDRNERIYWMEFDREAGEVRIDTYPDREDARKGIRWPNGPTYSEILGRAGLRGLD